MKFSKIALAAVCVAAAGQSFAAPEAGVFYASGASAMSITLVKGLTNLCLRNAGATAHVYKTGSSTSALGNFFTVACRDATNTAAVDFPNAATGAIVSSGFNEVRVDVAGGSLKAVQKHAAYTGTGADTAGTWLRSATAGTSPSTCTTFTGTAALTTGANFNATLYTCGTASNQTGKEGMGGLLDVDGAQFGSLISGVNTSSDFAGVGFRQAFGVALNDTLYRALQNYQKSINLLPATCAAGDTTIACQPTISRAQVASLMSNTNNNVAHTTPAAFLMPATSVDAFGVALANPIPAPAEKQTMYCRRPNTSGTQAGAELYFLHAVLGLGDAGGAQSVATRMNIVGLNSFGTHFPTTGATRGANFATSENSGSSQVINCLNVNSIAATATAISASTAIDSVATAKIGGYVGDVYRFGMLSAENLGGVTGSSTWKFARLSEVPVTEGTATANNTFTAAAGRYDYFFNAVQYCASGSCPALVTAAADSVPAGATSAGIFVGSETLYTRGAKSTQPVQSR